MSITGCLTVEATPGEAIGTTCRRALNVVADLPQALVYLNHNDTEVRVFATDTVKDVSDRWAAQRDESR